RGDAAKGDDKTEAVLPKLRLRQTEARHLLPHPADAQTNLLDVPHLHEHPGDDLVSEELVVTQTLQRDGRRPLTGAPDLQTVIEHKQSYLRAFERSVAVGDRVGDRLAEAVVGARRDVYPPQALHP